MTEDMRPPYRVAFDNARDPYTARNALGVMGTGGGFITSVTSPLSVTGGILTLDTSGFALLAGANVFTSTNTFRGGGTAVEGLTGGNASQSWTNYQNAAGSPNLQIRHSRGATFGAHAAVAVNDPLGQISFQGSDGAAFVPGVNIQAFCEATPVSGHIQSNIRFSVDDGTVVREMARIDKTGLTLPSPGGLHGNTTAAPAGNVGEFVQANKTTSSGALTAAVIGTYHSTSLTAGDWDVWMHSTVVAPGGGGSGFELELTTGASLSGNNLVYITAMLPSAGASHSVDIQPVRFLLASTTTINLNYRAGVTGCSISNAYIAARRRS